ncbi:hypothetical protein GPECTOR_15g297 [Gonium pectorale]|uniref:Uncharacterized protein n=1 Tax=Gonium pectorale TaxID=33097 RepID=A0A150GLD4_GONPE|nr:hypothetical protein GPECTOR_15g297 [Gonium pectorale]|eukprot:KXZ50614.1 hypothetical protein GPECTOR_15g297 [Gonium pectorale]
MPAAKGPAANPDLNTRDDEGRTPLTRACAVNDLNAVRSLLAAGANVNATDYVSR